MKNRKLQSIRELHACLIKLLKYRMYSEISQILLTKINTTNMSELKTALICTKGIDELSKPRESILETYNKLKQSN